MGGTVVRAILDRGQYPSLQLGCAYGRLLARMPLFDQPCHTMRAKSLLPTRDSRSRGIQNLLDLPVRDALAQQQHHALSSHPLPEDSETAPSGAVPVSLPRSQQSQQR